MELAHSYSDYSQIKLAPHLESVYKLRLDDPPSFCADCINQGCGAIAGTGTETQEILDGWSSSRHRNYLDGEVGAGD